MKRRNRSRKVRSRSLSKEARLAHKAHFDRVTEFLEAKPEDTYTRRPPHYPRQLQKEVLRQSVIKVRLGQSRDVAGPVGASSRFTFTLSLEKGFYLHEEGTTWPTSLPADLAKRLRLYRSELAERADVFPGYYGSLRMNAILTAILTPIEPCLSH
jgi:hypothetical protein